MHPYTLVSPCPVAADSGSAGPISLTGQMLSAAYEALMAADDRARAMAVNCLVDWFGCGLRGAGEPLVHALVKSAGMLGAPGAMPLLGRAERVGLSDMVLINGASGHALDYDDGHGAMMGHPSAPIAPALLGLAASLSRDGSTLMDAYILAVDVAARVGMLLAPDHYDRGFHGTATAGAIGAAAGCALLLGLDQAATAKAIGLAGTRAAGLRASFGTDAKPLHAGWAGLIGLTAAVWSRNGLTGHADLVGSACGLRTLSNNWNPDAAIAAHHPLILDTTFKHHAACAGAHPTIEAVRGLVEQHAVSPADVAGLVLRVNPRLDNVCNRQRVDSGLEAKFSLRMLAAMALSGIDTAAPESFSDAVVQRHDLQALFSIVAVELDPTVAPTGGEVVLTARCGAVYRSGGNAVRLAGDAARSSLDAKFRVLAEPVIGADRAARLLARLRGIATVADMASVAREASLTGNEPDCGRGGLVDTQLSDHSPGWRQPVCQEGTK